jgi:23S rRNA (cytidine1920-2'-O)/16S rRNA (cytidine1409-2'-O)-methyltransferase
VSTRADKYLVEQYFFETRAKAQEAIAAGSVMIDGQPCRKPSQKVPDGAEVTAKAAYPWVARSAVKLAAALDAFKIDPGGQTCLDLGASTGGFTEVLLSRGADCVYAVDVGRDQLHKKLRKDERVISMESTDARHLEAEDFAQPPSLIVCDVSFISVLKLIERPMSLAAPNADLIVLIKPQFEVGRASIDRGGLVNSQEERERAVREVRAGLDGLKGFTVRDIMNSPIDGGDGNQEYLLIATRRLNA